MRFVLLLALFLHAINAQEQLILLDTEVEITSAFHFFPPPQHSPENWTSPIDYTAGDIYVWVELKKQATDTPFKHQICLFQGKHHACTGLHLFTSIDIGKTQSALKKIWNADKHKWNEPISRIMLVTKDKDGKPVSEKQQFAGKWTGAPDFSLYYPYTIHCVITLVPPGAQYQEPGRLGDLNLRTLKHFSNTVEAVREKQYAMLWKLCIAKIDDKNQEIATEAKALKSALEKTAKQQLVSANEMLDKNPVDALHSYQAFIKQWNKTPYAEEASTIIKQLKKDRDFKQSLKAWTIYNTMKKASATIKQPFDINDTKQANRHKKEIQLLIAGLKTLQKKHKDSPATKAALKLCASFGLPSPR